MRVIIAIVILAHLVAYLFNSGTPISEAESLRERELDRKMEKYRDDPEFKETVGEQSWLLQEEQ